MKERRKNVQKFTLLSDDLSMEDAITEFAIIPQGVATTSGDEGLDDLSLDIKRADSTASRESRISTPPVTKSLQHRASASRSIPMKKRINEKQNQEPVIIPRRRKSRQQPSRTCSRGGNNILLAVELNPEFHKPGSRGQRLNTPPTKERVLVSQEEKEQEPPDVASFTANILNDVHANRDRLFGGEPEPKERPRLKTARRRRRPKPGDNSEQHVCWWIGASEDDEPLPPKPRPIRQMSAGSNSDIRNIFTGEIEEKVLITKRKSTYKIREEESGNRIFGSPEVKKTISRCRPGDKSQSTLFGSDSLADLPPRPNTVATSSGLSTTKDRLFGDGGSFLSPRPMSKHFPERGSRIFLNVTPRDVKSKASLTARQSVSRNPISGEGVSTSKTSRESACQSSNPITGEGYRPCKRDIHAVTWRL